MIGEKFVDAPQTQFAKNGRKKEYVFENWVKPNVLTADAICSVDKFLDCSLDAIFSGLCSRKLYSRATA